MASTTPQFGAVDPQTEYISRPGGYAVVVNDGLVAVVRTSRGVFLPGGGAEQEESLSDAATRETLEETGLVIKITGEIGSADEFVSSDKYEAHFCKHCTFFAAEPLDRIDEYEQDHELHWETPTRADALLSHESQRWAIAEYCRQKNT